MKRNILKDVIIIVIGLVLFSVLYYVSLVFRYKKMRQLILDRSYLDQLFKKSNNPQEASQDENGDILIEEVNFLKIDFQFSDEINNLQSYFQDNQIGSELNG